MTVRKIIIRFCNNIRHFSNEIYKRGGGIFLCGGWNFSKLVSLDSTFIREMRVGNSRFHACTSKQEWRNWGVRGASFWQITLSRPGGGGRNKPKNYYLPIQIFRHSAIPAKDRGWAIFKVVSNFTKQAACLLQQICSFADCVFIFISQQQQSCRAGGTGRGGQKPL